MKALSMLLLVWCLVPIAELQDQNESSLQKIENGNETHETNQSTNCPSTASEGPDQVSEWCKFWLQGIFLTLIGLCGIIGNLVSVFVLTRPCMLSTFNLILAFMTSVDTVFLVSSIIEYSLVQAFKLSSLEYDKAFVYFLYPTHNVTLVCSIYLHIVMAFERYLAVCHPELVYASQPRHRRSNRSGNNPNHSGQDTKVIRKKALTYILPVLLWSILLNLPKWFELELKDMIFTENVGLTPITENTTNEVEVITIVAGTWLRYNDYYITYYMHWTLFLTTGVLPLAALFYLNLRIYLRLRSVRQVRTSTTNSRNEPNYAATLASIIIIFIVCHMPRLLKTVYEIIFLNLLEGSECSGIITPAKCMPQIINLVLVINASSGFLIYCFIGTFGEKFLEVLTVSCRCRRSRSTTVEFQLPASQGPHPHQGLQNSGTKMTETMANGKTLQAILKPNGTSNKIDHNASDFSENIIVILEEVQQHSVPSVANNRHKEIEEKKALLTTHRETEV